MQRSYAGIGSRETPEEILTIMNQMAVHLGNLGVILRTGGAQGADKAFENGCDSVNGPKEIYLPWKGFENSKSTLIVFDKRAFDYVDQFHPGSQHLTQGARKLQARNSHQILGWNLDNPSDFILCYTPKGKRSGGTGQALRMAEHFKIPIFDCGLYEEDLEELKNQYRIFLKNVFEQKTNQ